MELRINRVRINRARPVLLMMLLFGECYHGNKSKGQVFFVKSLLQSTLVQVNLLVIICKKENA